MEALPVSPISTRLRIVKALFRLGVWAVTMALILCSLIVNQMLLAAPAAYERVHNMEGWVPMSCATDEVQNFLDASFGRVHPSLASWPIRVMTEGAFDPREIDHAGRLAWMFVYRLTLDLEIRRELAFNRTLSISPVPQQLTLEGYLLASHETRAHKQRGLTHMQKQGSISPARHRELKKLLKQAFPDENAYNW